MKEKKLHDTRLIVNTKTINDNIKAIRNIASPKTKFMFVVKANAYGLGTDLLDFIDQNFIDYYAVAHLFEAKEILNKVKQQILVFKNASVADIKNTDSPQIEFTISDLETLYTLDRYLRTSSRVIPIHININTGMNRLGINLSEIDKAIKILTKSNQLLLRAVYTHFASANDSHSSFTLLQNEKFKKVIKKFRKCFPKIFFHAANSAASLTQKETHYDMLRCGLSAYGILPLVAKSFKNRIHESFSLVSKVIQTRIVNKDESVGYKQTFIAKKNTRVASIAIGYADGANRLLSNKGHVFINSKLYPIIGIISMDQLSIDIGDDNITIGQDVYILSANKNDAISSETLAKLCKSIPYEIITSIGNRVIRNYT